MNFYTARQSDSMNPLRSFPGVQEVPALPTIGDRAINSTHLIVVLSTVSK